MAITTAPFGLNNAGEPVTQYTMTNASGASVSMIDYGAIVTSIIVPDKNGVMADVALGGDSMDYYNKPHGCMGHTVGRYGNRIARGQFTLDGVSYQLATNNGVNHLHGGKVGFGSRMWGVSTVEEATQDKLVFHYVSPDGEENYPGTIDVMVTYCWDNDCNLSIRYQATTDKATLLNMTNHTYFNLAGHDSGSIKDQVVFIDADAITAVDSGLIPTGAYLPVAGTALDLRDGMVMGEGIAQCDAHPMMAIAKGYDHNYVLRKGLAFGLCACAYDEASGRSMEVLTDQPGVQLYTSNTTNLSGGKGGVTYGNYCGFCLETQHFPDSPNHPHFPGTTVLRPGEVYDTTTIYAFRVDA